MRTISVGEAVGMPEPDAAQVREDDGTLDREHAVERANGRRMLVRTDRREAADPGRVVGE